MVLAFHSTASLSVGLTRSMSGWTIGCVSFKPRLSLKRKPLQVRVRTRTALTPLMMEDNSSNPSTSKADVELSTNESIDPQTNNNFPAVSEPPSDGSNEQKQQYSLRTRLREETEAPFRKARMFVYAGSAVSAGVGAFIASLRIIAAFIGISGTQPLNETVCILLFMLLLLG